MAHKSCQSFSFHKLVILFPPAALQLFLRLYSAEAQGRKEECKYRAVKINGPVYFGQVSQLVEKYMIDVTQSK